MAKSVLIESSIQAKDNDALNRYAEATVAVGAGGLVSLTAPTDRANNVWTAGVPSALTLGGLYMAYAPTDKNLVSDGLDLGMVSPDPRLYDNTANKPFTVFKPKVGDEIIITIDGVDASGSDAVAGDILESKASQTTFARIASATGATAGSTAFKIENVGTEPFPKAGIGTDYVKSFKAVCIQE